MSRWTPVGLPYPLWGKSRGFIWHSCQFIMVRIGTTKDSPSKCRLDHTQVKSSPFRGCMDQSGSYQRPTQTQCSSDSMIAQELIVPSWWPDVRFSILPSTMSTLGKIKDFTSVASVTITASLVVAGSTYVYVAFVFFLSLVSDSTVIWKEKQFAGFSADQRFIYWFTEFFIDIITQSCSHRNQFTVGRKGWWTCVHRAWIIESRPTLIRT